MQTALTHLVHLDVNAEVVLMGMVKFALVRD
jgi:hypothetical protein